MTDNSGILRPVIMKVPESARFPRGRDRVRALSQLARQAAHISAHKSGLDLTEFRKDQDGAPIPTDNIYWSISHKTEYVGGVVATKPVGIDIEKKRDVHPGLMEKIAGKGEWALVKDHSVNNFLRFWTAKEAVLKAMGVGFTGLSNCHIVRIIDENHIIVEYEDKRLDVHQTWFTEKYIAAVTDTGASIRWVFV